MKAIKYYGVFRGAATMPLAAFAIGPDADAYASRRSKMTVKVCYMDCGLRCECCGSIVPIEEEEEKDE